MKQIIVLSIVPWQSGPSRIRHMVSRMKNHRVLFVNPPPGMDFGRIEPESPMEKGWRDEGEAVDKWLTVLTPPPMLPFSGRYRAASRLTGRRVGRYISSVMENYGFVKPVLWCTSAICADIVQNIPHSAVIYDASYDHLLAGGRISPEMMGKLDKELSSLAALTLASSGERLDSLSKNCSNTRLLPNGVDFELFNRVAEGGEPFPKELFNIQNPMIGHIGTVDSALDLTYIEAAAKVHPEWSFVFVGKIYPDADLSPVEGLKNVHMLGQKSYHNLPSYLQRFDVCVNISRSAAWGLSPLKLYEYLATGKPIVSTPHPKQVLDYMDVVYLAGTHEEFCEQCRKAISEHDAWRVRSRTAYGKAASWDARVRELESYIAELGM